MIDNTTDLPDRKMSGRPFLFSVWYAVSTRYNYTPIKVGLYHLAYICKYPEYHNSVYGRDHSELSYLTVYFSAVCL